MCPLKCAEIRGWNVPVPKTKQRLLTNIFALVLVLFYPYFHLKSKDSDPHFGPGPAHTKTKAKLKTNQLQVSDSRSRTRPRPRPRLDSLERMGLFSREDVLTGKVAGTMQSLSLIVLTFVWCLVWTRLVPSRLVLHWSIIQSLSIA
jgi:hypothetical protein